MDGIDDVSADVAVAWLASVSVYTVNVHESALDSVLGTVECNLHHRVKWNLKTEQTLPSLEKMTKNIVDIP